jgi:hypothetical protein
MINFLSSLKQINSGIRKIQFPHYHRKFTAPALRLPIDLLLLLIIILIIFINLFHSLFIGFNEEKGLKRKIVSFPSSPIFHEQLGEYYTKYNLAEAGKEYLLANELLKENSYSMNNNSTVLGITFSPSETWIRLIGYNQTLTDDLNGWNKIADTFPNYSYTHLVKAFLYDKLGNSDGVKEELQNLGWDYKNIPEVINLKNKYSFR